MVKAKIYGVIVAGGIGSRMGCKDRPKQFMMLAGKPIIIRTIERFIRINEFREIIVLCPDEWVGYTKDLIKEFLPEACVDEVDKGEVPSERLSGDGVPARTCMITVICGGDTRNETIMRAIDHIDMDGALDDDTVIVTHDSVRPFVTEEIIRANIACVTEGDEAVRACTTAIPATDTILVSRDARSVSDIPDRMSMYQCQTPQTFPAGKLRELYRSLSDDEREVLTDAARIFLMKGEKVHIVPGDVANIKITYPHDMAVAEAMLEKLD